MLGGGLVFLLAAKPNLSATHRHGLEFIGLILIVLAITIFNRDSAWLGWLALFFYILSSFHLR